MGEVLQLPCEVWHHVFRYVSPADCLQLSLVCSDFNHLLQSDVLWWIYCQRKVRIPPHQLKTFSSCCPRELYKVIIKPFGFAIGMKVLWPGMAHYPANVSLRGGSLVIEAGKERERLLLTAEVSSGELVVEDRVSGKEMGTEELRKFLRTNVVMYFMGQYMYISSMLP